GVFASALGYLAQTWAQRRATATQTALAFTLEPVWTAFFGFTLAGDRLGAVAWLGCVLIMAGIGIAEPSAAGALARLVRRPRPAGNARAGGAALCRRSRGRGSASAFADLRVGASCASHGRSGAGSRRRCAVDRRAFARDLPLPRTRRP